MDQSPIEPLLTAVDALDIEGVMALMGPDPQLLAADGRRVSGTAAVRELLSSFIAELRAADHEIAGLWHQEDVWVAEVEATYELRDFLRLNRLPRVFVVRVGPGGISDVRVYGAHEHPLNEHRAGKDGMWVGKHWLPPL